MPVFTQHSFVCSPLSIHLKTKGSEQLDATHSLCSSAQKIFVLLSPTFDQLSGTPSPRWIHINISFSNFESILLKPQIQISFCHLIYCWAKDHLQNRNCHLSKVKHYICHKWWRINTQQSLHSFQPSVDPLWEPNKIMSSFIYVLLLLLKSFEFALQSIPVVYGITYLWPSVSFFSKNHFWSMTSLEQFHTIFPSKMLPPMVKESCLGIIFVVMSGQWFLREANCVELSRCLFAFRQICFIGSDDIFGVNVNIGACPLTDSFYCCLFKHFLQFLRHLRSDWLRI